MTYLALARKWRPKRFEQIVGQLHVVQSLINALIQNKIHHAYLLTGTHGTGKTTIARIFAKCLNCETGVTSTPCEQCNHCQEIDNGRFPDLYEIDAASRTRVEDTRELLDNIPYLPTKGRFKVYLIDEVHMLSGHSFNALLKTLEEPPAHIKFLLATTDPQKLPATVLSRCLQFHLSKINVTDIENQLAFILESEKIIFEREALVLISHSANGSMRDSLSLLDQCIIYGDGQIKTTQTQTLLGLSHQADLSALLDAIHKNDAQTTLELTKSWDKQGVNFARCLADLITHLYQIAVKQSINNDTSRTMSREDVQLYYQIALIGQRDLPLAPTAQIGFEMIVLRMMAFTPDSNATISIECESKMLAGTNTCSVQQNISHDWSTLLQQLKLTGPALALAQHCGMHSMTNNSLQLTLRPKYIAMNTAKQQQRIQDAFTQLMGHDTKVIISVEENKMETPASLTARLQEDNKKSAEKTIDADIMVQRIVKSFDAIVIDGSIESTH